MGDTKEVATLQATPADLLKIAIDKDADIDKLEKLMDLQERWEAGEAKKAYNKSMVKAQSDMPIVPEDAKNRQTNSTYSKYETVLKYTKPIYTGCGFSISFFEGETQKENHIRICANVMHELGHTENHFVDIPIDDKGIKGSVNKTQTHAKGSSISYGRGYLIKMVFNIPTGDDDDGNGAGSEKITESQVADIAALIEEVKGNKVAFLNNFKIESLADLPLDKYGSAIKLIEAKRNDS